MGFYYSLMWYFVINFSFSYADDFRLDDYEEETRKWKDPHADVFSYSEPEKVDYLSESLGTAKGAVQCDKLHAAIEACQNNVFALNRQVKNTDVNIQRLIKHLVKIHDESVESYEGIVFMQLSHEDKKILKSFANDGKFPTNTYNNIHELLKKSFTLPSKSLLDRVLPSINFFSTLPLMVWNGAVFLFQGIRVLLMQFVFSSDVATYATMILPPLTFFFAMRSGRSAVASLMVAGITVGFISYFVELRSAIETARAKDLARMTRTRYVPSECKAYEELGIYDMPVYWFRSVFSMSDRCEEYYRNQVPDSSIEPSEVFWKILFTPVTVCMDKFGHGLRVFVAVFGKDLGWVSSIYVLPLGVIALLWFLALLLSFFSGGSLKLPLLGSISFSNPLGRLYNPIVMDPPVETDSTSTAVSPTVSNNFNIQVFNAPHPVPSLNPSYPGLNMSIVAPSGHALEFKSAQTSETNHNLQITCQEPTVNVIQHPQITSGSPETIHETHRAPEQLKPIAMLQEPVQSNNANFQSVTGALLANASVKEPRPSLVVGGFSETGHNRSFETRPVSRHCALEEIGAGDFVPRASGILRWRHHHRKLSL